MSIILKTLKDFFHHSTDTPIVIAYSGGVDSQVLLHALATLKKREELSQSLSACHINHGLSLNAEQWQLFAKHQCEQFTVPFFSQALHIEKKNRQSLEAIAREKRYQVLEQYSPENANIVTGHHQDDQIETFFLALKRGSGLKGLSAMALCQAFGHKNQQLVRPLLSCSRQDILHYAQAHELAWIEDESNKNTAFDRNFLRHAILPALKKRWPSIDKTIARSISHCQESQAVLDEIAQQDLKRCSIKTKILDVMELKKLSLPRFNHLIRYFLAINHAQMPSQQQLAQLHQQIFAEQDKTPELKLADVWFRKFKNELHLTPSFENLVNWKYELPLNELKLCFVQGAQRTLEINLPDELGKIVIFESTLDCPYEVLHSFSVDHIDEYAQVVITFSHNNPKCLPEHRDRSRSLKKVLQESNISPWQRKRTPLLFVDNELVAAFGHFVCKPFLPNAEKRKINVSWLGQS